MSVSCKCVKPFLELLGDEDTLADAVAKGDMEAFKDVVRDATDRVREVERECGVMVPEHVKRHLVHASELAKRERVITTTMRYEAEEGLNDSVYEVKRLLCR